MNLTNNFFIILIIFFLYSCTEKSKVEIKGEMVIINPAGNRVEDIHEDIWKVGSLGKQTISKGIRVEIGLPLIKKSKIQSIFKKQSMDAWIIKVKQSSMYRNQTIGYIYFPLMAPGYSRGSSLRIKQLKKAVFGIHYTASAVSTRLARLNCPAFDHKYRVEQIKVDSDSGRSSKIYISKSQSKRVMAKVQKFENRIILNGGKFLRGEYYFELAAYNSNTKLRLSNWVEIFGRVIVGMDKKVEIKGCSGVKVPNFADPKLDKKSKFKFGR